MANAQRMAAATAEQLGIDADLVLVSSTGVIGQQLPMDKIENGIQAGCKRDSAPKVVQMPRKRL